MRKRERERERENHALHDDENLKRKLAKKSYEILKCIFFANFRLVVTEKYFATILFFQHVLIRARSFLTLKDISKCILDYSLFALFHCL